MYDKLQIQNNKDNRNIILPVIKTVTSGLCGRQGISLRSHRDYGSLEFSKPTENDGNFRTLLRFYVNATRVSRNNSHILARENCNKNARYISWKIQNRVIEACYTVLSKKINNCKYFSILLFLGS